MEANYFSYYQVLSYLCAFHGFAEETGADKNFIGWQGHDFSYRGMSGNEDAIMSAMAHLTSFYGTDTVPVISCNHTLL